MICKCVVCQSSVEANKQIPSDYYEKLAPFITCEKCETPFLDESARRQITEVEGFLELGMVADALQSFRKIDEKLRYHPAALIIFWEIAARMGEWAKSLSIAKGIVGIWPHKPDGYLNYARALKELSQVNDAIRLLENIQAEMPNAWEPPYDLAFYYEETGRVEQARSSLLKAVEIGGSDVKRYALKDCFSTNLKSILTP